MPERARIAVVGAGSMANSVHYPSLASFDDVDLVGICELDAGRLRETADKYNVEGRYSDYRRMVSEVAPDGIYVIGQPQYMYDIWIWCLQEGLNLYIEKPMGLNWHQARMLAALAAKKDVVTQVSHQRRSSPLLRKMRAACVERGPLTHAVCEFFKCQMEPMYGARDHMLDDCTHSIDTLRWMCGGEVEHIHSQCKRVGTPDINWIGATIEFDSGATGVLVNSWASGRRVFRVQMHAPGIYCDAEVESEATLYRDGDYEGQTFDARQVAGGSSNWEAFGFRDKNREFIDSILTGRDVTSSPFRDCIKTMEVAEKILAQALLSLD